MLVQQGPHTMSYLCCLSFFIIVCYPASQTVGCWHTPSEMCFINLLDCRQSTQVDLKIITNGVTVLKSCHGQSLASAQALVGTIPVAQAGGTEREIDGAECLQLCPWEDGLCLLSL